jgi:hypothetical protein
MTGTDMSRSSIARMTCALGLVLSASQPVFAQPREPGDLWEVTQEFSMPGLPAGMAMPQQPPQRVCRARNADRPPVADNDRCEMSDVKRTANSFSWKAVCKGDPPTSGTGEIVYQGRDRYTGTMKMTVGNDTMTMKINGKRVGDCDAGEQRRQMQAQVAAVQQQAAEGMAMQCKAAVENLMPSMMRPEFGCEAKYKTELCGKAQSQDGFKLVAQRQPSHVAGIPSGDLNEVGAFCGFAANDLRLRLCKRADADESLDFLAAGCLGFSRNDGAPVGAGGASGKSGDTFGAAIIARECAGRTFSSPPAKKYVAFCSAAARQKLMQPVAAEASASTQAPAAAPEEKKEDAASRGKRLLKDIFGR